MFLTPGVGGVYLGRERAKSGQVEEMLPIPDIFIFTSKTDGNRIWPRQVVLNALQPKHVEALMLSLAFASRYWAPTPRMGRKWSGCWS